MRKKNTKFNEKTGEWEEVEAPIYYCRVKECEEEREQRDMFCAYHVKNRHEITSTTELE